MPIRQTYVREKIRPITDADKEFRAFEHVRRARGAAKSVGRKEKKAKEREQDLAGGAKAAAKEAKEPKEKKEKKAKA